MDKLITARGELLEMFSKVTKNVKPEVEEKDLEPILDIALDNFNREMQKPLEEFDDTPDNMKAHIFQILIKHFVIGMKNERLFRDENLSEISKQLEKLAE